MPPSDEGLKVELADGSSVDIGILYVRPPFLHSPLVSQMGLKLKEPFMTVEVDMFHKSSNPLVYVGGDVASFMPSVGNAVSSGGIAGAGCNHDLAAEDWAEALKEAGLEVKAAGSGHGQDFTNQVGKMMEKSANKDEVVKAVNGD